MKLFYAPILLSILFLNACSESSPDSKSYTEVQNEVIEEDGSNITGIYAADIWPVNYNLHFKKLGAVAVTREGDNFIAQIKMKYAPKNTELRPYLYTGRRCPNIEDDLNKDAYIDILEARLAIGQVTIPFDGDLDSQEAGKYQHNFSDVNGVYAYENSSSFDRMFSDLKSRDENTSDNMIKLKENEGLTLPGRVVIFHGLSESIKLPESIATTGGETAHQSIPVACAVLWKVPSLPVELIPEPINDL